MANWSTDQNLCLAGMQIRYGDCHDPQECVLRAVGGVTAVINASACGVLQTAHQHSGEIGKVYAGCNGIIGALTEDLIDTSIESQAAIAGLKHTPGAAFGSCRYKLASIAQHRAQYERLIEVFQAHDIGYFFYNGGGDSQDTAHKVGQIGAALSYPVVGVGIPKTADWAVADYLQRSARHIASETDVEQAYAVGSAAVEFAMARRNAIMPAIRRISDLPYRWDIIEAPRSAAANQEKLLPPEFVSADGFGIAEAAPLIVGEAFPPFKNGLPDYVRLHNVATPKKLTSQFAI